MKKIILSLFLIFSIAAGVIAVSYNEAWGQAKPTVLLISAPMCGACKDFEPAFEAAKSKFSDKFDFVKEYYSSSKRAKKLNVTETPSVFILNGKSAQKIEWSCLNDSGCFEQRLKDY